MSNITLGEHPNIKIAKYESHICKHCGKNCVNKKALGIHLHKDHESDLFQYTTTFFYEGVRPKCSCGCGQDAPWHKTEYRFGLYISGHNESQFAKGIQPIFTKEQIEYRNQKIRATYNGENKDVIRQKISSGVRAAHDKIPDLHNILSSHAREQWQNDDFRDRETAKRNTEEYKDFHRKIANDMHVSGTWGVATYTEESHRKLSEHAIKLLEQGKIGPMATHKTEWKFNPFMQQEEHMHSSYETLFLDNCIKDNIPITKKHNIRIYYTDVDRTIHAYVPDFMGVNNKTLYETKPENLLLDQTNICKFNAAQNWCNDNGYKYYLVLRDDLDRNKNILDVGTIAYNKLSAYDTAGAIQIKEYIESLVFGVIIDQVSGILNIPGGNFAIDYSGPMWKTKLTNENYKRKNNDSCAKNNVKLFHVFFDEWRDKSEIVKSMILNRLGKSSNKLFARDCDLILNMSDFKCKDFFEKNHISGHSSCKVAFGLKYNNELVCCLSLRSPRQKKYNGYIEIKRFASKLNYNVVGGFSRLLCAAEKWAKESGYKGIVTYADLRFGRGDVYLNNGFKLLGETMVDYWYTNGCNRFDRFKYRARNGKPERLVAEESGVYRVYGCGSKIFLRDFANCDIINNRE